MRMNKNALGYQVSTQKGLISCMDYSKDGRMLHISTLGGYLLNYDFRLNSITEEFKVLENTPIIGLQTYTPMKGREYDLYSYQTDPTDNNYLLIWTAAGDHEMGLWNLKTANFDMLFKVNPSEGKEIKPLTTEIPGLFRIRKDTDEYQNSDEYNLNFIYKNISRYTHLFENMATKNTVINYVSSEFYSHSNKRLSKLTNLFDVVNTVQIALSPMNTKMGDINNFSNENVPYIISAGNDMTIRYWDITKESLYGTSGTTKRSYLVNAPNKIENCIFSTSSFEYTTILQSNEIYNSKTAKKDSPFFSEYQNYNGIDFHPSVQQDFDSTSEVLKFCQKVSDASHKNVITDLITVNITDANYPVLVSSSWDGTLKVWK
jgi:hypothetical protein